MGATSHFITLILICSQIWHYECKKVRIPDNLDDVVDDEEDEEWKAWGKPKSGKVFDPPPDLTGMTPQQIQAEMAKRQLGPSIGFVKLRLDVPRTREQVPLIAQKWTKLLRTGSIDAKITAVDINTLMFSIDHAQDTMEVKDFVLNQEEAYEFKIGQHAYRRPDDPPLEIVIEKLQRESAHNQEL